MFGRPFFHDATGYNPPPSRSSFIYFMVVGVFGCSLGLTPVVSLFLFHLMGPSGLHLYIHVSGFFDFATWGWLVKLVVCLIGLAVSLTLLPLIPLLALASPLTRFGLPVREAVRRAAAYVRALLNPKKPVHNRWFILVLFVCWALACVMMAAVYVYTAQLTVLQMPSPSSLPLLPLYFTSSLPVDPHIILMFLPVDIVPIPPGVFAFLSEVLSSTPSLSSSWFFILAIVCGLLAPLVFLCLLALSRRCVEGSLL